MSPAEAIAALPDETPIAVVVGSGELTIGALRAALSVGAGEQAVTTTRLAEELGHSPEWWQDRARSGEIHGAYQAGPKAPWYIPREQAKVFLREYRERKRRKRHARTPWKGPQKAA